MVGVVRHKYDLSIRKVERGVCVWCGVCQKFKVTFSFVLRSRPS